MNRKEFEKFVLEEATKIIEREEKKRLDEQRKTTESKEVLEEEFSPEQIKILAEKMKEINKKTDLRNPLLFEKVEGVFENVISESEKGRMQKLYNYKKVTDEDGHL